jgi:hypothetical protein
MTLSYWTIKNSETKTGSSSFLDGAPARGCVPVAGRIALKYIQSTTRGSETYRPLAIRLSYESSAILFDAMNVRGIGSSSTGFIAPGGPQAGDMKNISPGCVKR